MKKIRFKCFKCGHCCRTLLKTNFGITKGLSLSRDKIKHFPEDMVLPSTGFGLGPDDIKEITHYQLNDNVCPNLNEDNTCKIFNERPLACRCFPLISKGTGGAFLAHPDDCKFVEQLVKNIGSLNGVEITSKKFDGRFEWASVKKADDFTKERFSELRGLGYQMYFYNLNSQRWEQV